MHTYVHKKQRLVAWVWENVAENKVREGDSGLKRSVLRRVLSDQRGRVTSDNVVEISRAQTG